MKRIICDLCGQSTVLTCTSLHDGGYNITPYDRHIWGMEVMELLDEQTNTYRTIDLCPDCSEKYADMRRKADEAMQNAVKDWISKNMIPLMQLCGGSEEAKDES